VPVRVEIGPKDIAKNACAVARRDVPGKEGKQFDIPLDSAAAHIDGLLKAIQKNLFDRAKAFRDSRIVTADTLDEFQSYFPIEKDDEAGGEPMKFVLAHWDGTRETEDRVQKEFKATIRCLPFDGDSTPGKCLFSGKSSARRVVFARAY
jgi:prolyl-tRNA synthetase